MKPSAVQDRVFGLFVVAFGLWIALYWAPHDSETGLVEHVRGQMSVGDAMAPTVASAIMVLSGLWLILQPSRIGRISARNLAWLVTIGACIATSIAAMRWLGPALVEAITGADYRPLRDTFPWKYFGYLIGGTLMIASLIFLVERRFRWSRLLIALGVAVLLALLYDMPFDDLILPPNGDV